MTNGPAAVDPGPIGSTMTLSIDLRPQDADPKTVLYQVVGSAMNCPTLHLGHPISYTGEQLITATCTLTAPLAIGGAGTSLVITSAMTSVGVQFTVNVPPGQTDVDPSNNTVAPVTS